MHKRYEKELQVLKDLSCERGLKSLVKQDKFILDGNSKLLNLSSNDYLGIAENKDIIKKFIDTSTFSFGSASSRLLTGGTPIYTQLEKFLAEQYNKDSALFFNSGYHCNVGVMSALLSKKDAVFSDKLNHASILDGIKLSDAKMFRYKHLDYIHLEELLQKHRHEYDNAIIITESLFSMDGDIADLNKLISLKEKYNAMLVVDEAHAYGLYGDKGLGICEQQNCVENVDLIVATFGKAVGSLGAFCVGHSTIISYLVNKSRPLIFSTAIPEINVAFTYYVLKNIIPDMSERRKNIIRTAQMLRDDLIKTGLFTLGESHIVPVVMGSNEATIKVSNELIKNGYYVLPIRHPTVAKGSSRVRISLRADINYDEIKQIPQIITRLNGETVDNF